MDCPEIDCDGTLEMREGKFGKFLGCNNYRSTGCKGSHNVHQGSGKPMGTPADQTTKDARKQAHFLFDQLWQSGEMTRKEAYTWLQDAMGLSKEDAHISKMDLATCQRLIKVLKATA